MFAAAFQQGLSILLKGPTGCGKTRFVEAMAYQLGRPLITVACHDDLTTADLVGRYLLKGGETVWVDGPLTRAVRDRRDLLSRTRSSRHARTRRSSCIRSPTIGGSSRSTAWVSRWMRPPVSVWWCRTTRDTRACSRI